jgi:hypothetical protein
MTAAKKRNLFEEIIEGLEAYRDRRDTLPRHNLPAPDVKAIRSSSGYRIPIGSRLTPSAKKMTCRRTLG